VKRKLERFKEIETLQNVIEPSKEVYHYVKGKWNQDFFKNENPITVELACGRGEYTIGLAKLFPNNNYIGVDIKGERIWKGSSHAKEENLNNVAFLRTRLKLMKYGLRFRIHVRASEILKEDSPAPVFWQSTSAC
jgi:tRNA (guanine-N7-)-methyltransferase